MSVIADTIESPLTLGQMVRRWQALCSDPTFEDVPEQLELTECGRGVAYVSRPG